MTNPLYPAFFRLDRLHMLVVGAGEVGEEKLSFILKSSPNARVTIVAPWMGEDLRELLDGYEARTREAGGDPLLRVGQSEVSKSNEQGATVATEDRALEVAKTPVDRTSWGSPTARWRTPAGGHVTYYAREFRPDDVLVADLVVAATNFQEINHAVWTAAKANRRLANIADTPSLCDFYLGSIVTRGPLKVAISTNGQSPTFAKRFRQWLEAELPELETTNLLDNLKDFRDRLTGNFQTKVRELNNVTSSLLSSARESGEACRCAEGECLLEAATSGKDGTAPVSPVLPPNSGTAPATAPQKMNDD